MLRLAAAALCFTLSAAAQAPAFNVSQTIRRVSERCEAATQYMFEGTLVITGRRGAVPDRELASARVTMAVGEQGKYLMRVKLPEQGEYVRVSDGQKSWAYVPKLKRYTEEESAMLSRDEEGENGGSEDNDMVETFTRQVMPILTGLHKAVEAADTKDFEQVKFENRKEKWPVVRVLSKKEHSVGQSLTQLTMDPATLRIGRLVFANLTESSQGERTVIRLTVDFSRFRIGETLPDAEFTFTPPANAKLVDAVPIPGQTGSFLLNRPAPDFELKTLEGERVRLSELRGRPVLLSFWATWCGPCRRELPELAKIHEAFKDRLVVMGINDEGKGTARNFVRKTGIPFPTLDDYGEKANRLYRIRSIPTLYLIDAEGKVVRFLSGARDEAGLRAALKSVGL